MQALLSTIGSRGDVQPLVALALELRALGHEARLCVPPDFVEWIARLGFEVAPIGPELRKMTAAVPPRPLSASPAPALPTMTPERRRQLAEATVAAQFTTVAEAADGCDVIVAATALQIAARSVAEVRRIPYVFAAYSPNVLPSVHHAPPPLPPFPGAPVIDPKDSNEALWKRDTDRFNLLFGGSLNAHRATLGLSAIDDVRRHVFGERAWLAADATLAPWPDPDDQSVWQTGAWMLNDECPLSTEIDRFLDAGEPPIYFGFGSMRATPDLARIMFESARALGRRAIVSRGWGELSVSEPAADVLSIDEVNQQALFPRVAAVVHHGGAGTTTAAAFAGAPQVVIPQMYDQHYFARRVKELGIGAAHAPGAPSAESLTAALERALRPDIATRAAEVANRVSRDGARAAALRVVEMS